MRQKGELMSNHEEDDPNNQFRDVFESPDEYARRLFLRMNEQLERHSQATESRIEFILTQQAQFTTDMHAMREAQQRADERWERTESSIRHLLANDGRITTAELSPEILRPAGVTAASTATAAVVGTATGNDAGGVPPLREVERQQILAALEQTNWHRGKTAELLGISPSTLYRRLRDYNLTKRQ